MIIPIRGFVEDLKVREYGYSQQTVDALTAERDKLEAEVGRLQMMNPCNHTGFESAPCDICGYPDPRKLIARLKYERDADLRIEYGYSQQTVYELTLERDRLTAENKRLREALKYIAFTTPGPTMKTHSEAAEQALKEASDE